MNPMRYLRSLLRYAILLGLVLAGGTAFNLHGAGDEPPPPRRGPLYLPMIVRSLNVAVIGDYGLSGPGERDVAALVRGWNPDLIVTTGDNNYPDGSAATIDQNIGAYYHDFIAPYHGRYGPGGGVNRFFPAPGNHDWESGLTPYLEYFTLPGNERYYEVVWGTLHLFVLDSDPREPDGVGPDSAQAAWLQRALAASTACWKLVTMHHAPFSSGAHGSSSWMQWPYAAWGADALLAGHDHTYERIVGDVPYFVNGLGGNLPYPFETTIEGSQARFNADLGAMSIVVAGGELTFQFVTRAGIVVDTYQLRKSCS